jgi:hypothetical protein
MFRVEFMLHIRQGQKWVVFRRQESIPFAPFVGLDVLDDAVGEFHLKHVAWHSGSQLFLCQAEQRQVLDRQLAGSLRKVGWIKDEGE